MTYDLLPDAVLELALMPVEGVYTKSSAIYTDELSAGLGWVFLHALTQLSSTDSLASDLVCIGLENQLVNEIMQGSQWELVSSWRFKSPQHINLLELKSVERLVEKKAKQGSLRFACHGRLQCIQRSFGKRPLSFLGNF